MISRLQIEWPDRQAFEGRDGRPIRFLVASDAPEPSLLEVANREALGRLDGILGCGDLEPEWLAFLPGSRRRPMDRSPQLATVLRERGEGLGRIR